MKILKLFPVLSTALILTIATGCQDSASRDHSHEGDNAYSQDSGQGQGPARGATPVIVADHLFHLKLVLDATAGKMQAYVMDGHFENTVQVVETNFLMVARAGANTEQLNFRRAPDAASGNVPEKSSLFEAQSEWLKTATQFEGSIPEITLNGRTFRNISFSFPKGSLHVH